MILKGSWVQIHRIILMPNERAKNIPEDTRSVPLEMWCKGYLVEDCELGEIGIIETSTQRLEQGTVVALEPTYKHNYGEFVSELLEIDKMVKSLVFEGHINE